MDADGWVKVVDAIGTEVFWLMLMWFCLSGGLGFLEKGK